MPQEKPRQTLPAGHVIVPGAAIGGLSLVLAAGLELLGIIDRLNTLLTQFVSHKDGETPPNHLPLWSIWLAAALVAYGLATAILGTPGNWRRLILWITAIILMTTWAPVLGLASYTPDIAAPWIATLWSGVCAMVYAANHRMACDTNP